MKKSFKLMLEIGGFCAFAPLGMGLGYYVSKGIIKAVESSNIEKYKKIYGDTFDYYLKTNFGVPVSLPIKDNMISVVFDSFNEEAKQNARYAISKLDDVLKTQEFTIYDTGQKPEHNNYIKISLKEDVKAETDTKTHYAIANTIMNYDKKTGKMIYPVQINIEKKYIDCYRYRYGVEDGPENSVFSSIIQHELGHALGLCDRYNKEDKGDTVMYYIINYNSQDYTPRDYHNLRYIYDKEYDVEVITPNKMQMVVYAPKKDMDEEKLF